MEKVLAGAIDIAFFYGVKLRKQAVFCQKFVYACDLSFDRTVVDQNICTLCGIIKIFHLHIHGRKCIFFLGNHICQSIIAARHGDHLGNVISGLSDIDGSTGIDREKSDCLTGICLIKQWHDLFHLAVKISVCLIQSIKQKTIEFDPLQPSQRMRFIGRPLDQHRNAQFFQFFFYFRCVIDHGIFDGKIAAFI